ncbi:polysaccharide deacetylase family protein [Brevibacillus humidisoli]|uniref:polysaccharide deacetylase family protein n=1 Tax=Brevibacillus humidisoli TaxID=2895522 RepID=UPI001E34FE8A|nr:polysaccharide deacetylase family protein [Brevibacillus humidisoli]UFJ40905.1 polysaccharide deacetylase family protein [Brevibacillus humidisoli]
MDEYRARIKSDLDFMNKRLEQELGPQPKLLAFPFGAYNDQVISIGRELGIELFFTTKEGINTPGNGEVYRINAGESEMSGSRLLAKLKAQVKR